MIKVNNVYRCEPKRPISKRYKIKLPKRIVSLKKDLLNRLQSQSGQKVFCLFFSVFIFLGIFVLSYCIPIKSQNNISAQTPFINLDALVQITPELLIEGENSIKSLPSPLFVESQVLGAVLEESDTEKDIIQYTVKENDTLWGIAQKYSVEVDTLLWANGLSETSSLQEGDKLIVLPVDGVLHFIEEGETVESIAQEYDTKSEKIIAFNELPENGEIFAGDFLVVPDGVISTPVVTSTYASSSSSSVTLPNSYFIIPTTGYITQGLHFYNAVDVANACGTPIYAAAAGTVQTVSNRWPYGQYVTILHPNGVTTLYSHLSSSTVYIGEYVSQGELIGYIGNTGRTIGITGCHLHFEVRGATNPLAKYPYGTELSF